MKERPILFSAPMVRAILDGSKTQTRRVVKLPKGADPDLAHVTDWGGIVDGIPVASQPGLEHPNCPVFLDCPYGVPGDRLWVREAWGKWENGGRQIRYRADLRCFEAMTNMTGDWIVEDHGAYLSADPGAWKPSIHMPRWASRITLEVTDVRVQRLQEISHMDCIAEGKNSYSFTKAEFARIWDSINSKTHPWDDNPWVWAITFREAKPEVRNEA